MASIKRLDPLDIRAVADWVKQTSRYRVLVLRRTAGRKCWALDAYSVTRSDPVLEHDAKSQGAVVVGYYTKRADPATLMADIAAAMVEL